MTSSVRRVDVRGQPRGDVRGGSRPPRALRRDLTFVDRLRARGDAAPASTWLNSCWAYWPTATRWLPTCTVCPGGVSSTIATRGLRGPARDREADQQGDRDRVDDQQRNQQPRAAAGSTGPCAAATSSAASAPRPRPRKATNASLADPRAPSPAQRDQLAAAAPSNSSRRRRARARVAWRSASPTLWVENSTLVAAPASAADEAPTGARAGAGRARRRAHRARAPAGRAIRPSATLTRWRLPPERRSTRSCGALGQARLREHARDRPLEVRHPLQAREQPQVLLDRQLRVQRRLLRRPADARPRRASWRRSPCRRSVAARRRGSTAASSCRRRWGRPPPPVRPAPTSKLTSRSARARRSAFRCRAR